MELGNVLKEIVVKVTVDDSGVESGFRKVEDEAKQAGQKTADNFTSGMDGLKSGVDKAFLPAVGILTGLGAMGMSAAKEAEAAAIAQSKLAGVMSSMGYAEHTKAVQDYAVALGNKIAVDNDDIASVQAVIATFGELDKTAGEANGYFNRVTAAAYDMAAVFGGDAQSAAMALSKALNSPEQAAALARTGTLTKEQAKYAAELAKTGRAEEARAFIMDAVEKQVSGAAASQITATQKMNLAYSNMMENLGTALLPIMQQFADVLSNIANFVGENTGLVTTLAVVIGGLAAAIIAVKIAITVYETATKLAAAAQWLWNVALDANPIGIIVLAIGALVGALVWFFTQTDAGRAIMGVFFDAIKAGFGWMVDGAKAVWNALSTAFQWMQANWPMLLGILTGPFGLAALFITQHWDQIVAFIQGVPDKLMAIGKSIANAIIWPWRTAINFIIDAWNAMDFGFSFTAPDWVPQVGGQTIGVDDLFPDFNYRVPELAKGGIINPTPGGTLVKVGEAGKREAVVPLDDKTLGGTVNVIFNGDVHGDAKSIAAAVQDVVDETLRRGQLRLVAAGGSY